MLSCVTVVEVGDITLVGEMATSSNSISVPDRGCWFVMVWKTRFVVCIVGRGGALWLFYYWSLRLWVSGIMQHVYIRSGGIVCVFGC